MKQTAYAPLTDNATIWKTLDQSFSAADANSYSSWNFGLDQQVLLVPDANKGAQIVINSRDAMEHPWHLQYAPNFSIYIHETPLPICPLQCP